MSVDWMSKQAIFVEDMLMAESRDDLQQIVNEFDRGVIEWDCKIMLALSNVVWSVMIREQMMRGCKWIEWKQENGIN